MKKLLIFLMIGILFIPTLVWSQESDLPIGVFVRGGMMDGQDRTSVAFDFSIGLIYENPSGYDVGVVLNAWRAEIDYKTGEYEVALEENVSGRAFLTKGIFGDWYAEGALGASWVDNIEDDNESVMYATGYGGLAYKKQWKNLWYGFALGPDYNFGNKDLTTKLTFLVEFR